MQPTERPPVDIRERQQAELTATEWRCIRVAVRHVLSTQDWNERGYLCDDAQQQAAIKLLALRITLTRLPHDDRDRYAVKSLERELYRWTKGELARRRRVDRPGEPGEDVAPPADLPDPDAGDWEGRIARCLLDDVGDERIAAALRALTPLQMQAVNLHYFHGLSLREIAGILDTREETVKSRLDGALARLRRQLGVHKDSHPQGREKSLRGTAPL